MGNVEPGELVGRAKEVAELERLVGRVAGGQGQAVVVRGEPGIGKTRLVKTALEACERLGFEAYVAAASEMEMRRPFGVIADAPTSPAQSAGPGPTEEPGAQSRCSSPRRHVGPESADLAVAWENAAGAQVPAPARWPGQALGYQVGQGPAVLHDQNAHSGAGSAFRAGVVHGAVLLTGTVILLTRCRGARPG